MSGCLYMRTLREDELLHYAIEGEALPHRAEEHMVNCNSCRQQLESLMSTNNALLRRLYRCRCPNIDILARYSAGLASLSEGLSVLYHLSFCPLCAQELQDMRQLLEDDPFIVDM
jgi:hypothetical protein